MVLWSNFEFKSSTLKISYRNIQSQCFNQILIKSTGFITLGPTAAVLAAQDSSAAWITAARPNVIKPVDLNQNLIKAL